MVETISKGLVQVRALGVYFGGNYIARLVFRDEESALAFLDRYASRLEILAPYYREASQIRFNITKDAA